MIKNFVSGDSPLAKIKIKNKGDYEAKAMLKMSEETKIYAEQLKAKKGKGW